MNAPVIHHHPEHVAFAALVTASLIVLAVALARNAKTLEDDGDDVTDRNEIR